MPPNLDIYVISAARNRETIERFLDTYVNRAASENRGNEQLMILPLDATDTPRELAGWEWEPSATLSHIVDRGLDFPRRAFCVYLSARDTSLTGPTLGTMSFLAFRLMTRVQNRKTKNAPRAYFLKWRKCLTRVPASLGWRNQPQFILDPASQNSWYARG